MDVGTAVKFYVVYVSRTGMGLGKGYVHVESIEPTYLREYMRRDSEHAPFDRPFIYMGSRLI